MDAAIVGRPTFAMLPSNVAINVPTETLARINHFLGILPAAPESTGPLPVIFVPPCCPPTVPLQNQSDLVRQLTKLLIDIVVAKASVIADDLVNVEGSELFQRLLGQRQVRRSLDV